MKRWLIPLTLALVAAAVVQFAVLPALPQIVMAKAMERVATQAGGLNRIGSVPPPDAASRTIVKPSPDLAYSICVFDIAQGPVLVGGRPAQGYWSLALYDADTNNFHVVNDRQAGAAGARLVLATQAQRSRIPAELRDLAVVTPPSAQGILLQRYLVLEASDLTGVKAAQADAVCRRI